MIKDLLSLEKIISEEMMINNNLLLNNVKNILLSYSGSDWENYVELSSTKYLKKNICQTELYDMYVITWDKNQVSPIHDHSSKGCVYKILEGKIVESIYDKNLNFRFKNIVQKNDCGCICNDIGYHSMNNSHDDICVSLHIYSPPNYKTKYFNNIN
tara:strand:+ start:446 stop:913 length:468 start_codon:yes stop_codon:yes gene_type:complete